MENKFEPVVARKMTTSQSFLTNKPLPMLDWPNVIRTINELRQWYIHSGEDSTAEALAAIRLLFAAMDERKSPSDLVESMLNQIGMLAYAWTTMQELPLSVRRQVLMVLTAAIHNLDAFEASVNLMLKTEDLQQT